MAKLTVSQTDYHNHQLELQNLWFIARSSGNYNKARWLRDQLKPHQDDVSTLATIRRSLLKSIEYWEKSYQRGTVAQNIRIEQQEAKLKTKNSAEIVPNLVRVAPAAIEIGTISAEFPPRLGNTGGTYTSGDITSRIPVFEATEYQIKLRKGKSSITKIDWLSVSFPYLSGEEEERLLWAAITDLMERCEIEIVTRNKGHHGYTNSAALAICESSGKTRNVGMLAWSEKQGYFMELSGVGCDYAMKHLDDLYTLISVYCGRISRLDVALDLHSDYCLANGFTVPKFAKQSAQGQFRSSFTPSHVKQGITHGGDWSCIINGETTADDYNATEHAAKGITVYVGSNKSDNQIVFYEKGKQLLGAVPDHVADRLRNMLSVPASSDSYEDNCRNFAELCEKHDLNPDSCSDRAWVRVERRLRRGANKKYISPDMLYDPDSAFCHYVDGLTELFQGYSEHVNAQYTDIQSFRRASAKRLQVMDMTKRLYYARQSVGSLVYELRDMDYSAEQIVEQLSSEYPIEDVVFDLLE